MKPEEFLRDLQAKPDHLRALSVEGAWGWLERPPGRIVLLGMGSSHYANAVAAARLRAAGLDAVAELASSDLLPRPRPDDLVLAVSASAGSAETLDAVQRIRAAGATSVVAVANREGALTGLAERTVWMGAGEERGGVACRSGRLCLALLNYISGCKK